MCVCVYECAQRCAMKLIFNVTRNDTMERYFIFLSFKTKHKIERNEKVQLNNGMSV